MIYLTLVLIIYFGSNNLCAMEPPAKSDQDHSLETDEWIDQCVIEDMPEIAQAWKKKFNPTKNMQFRQQWDDYCKTIKINHQIQKLHCRIMIKIMQPLQPGESKNNLFTQLINLQYENIENFILREKFHNSFFQQNLALDQKT